MIEKLEKQILILVGHYGSGKTEIAVNLAFYFNQIGKEVTIVDLDLIKPYFRCRLLREDFKARVIRLIAPENNTFYADLPILLPETRGVLERSLKNEEKVIIDVGGDDLGARVLGTLNDIVPLQRSELIFVVNHNRPFAEDVESVIMKIKEIEASSRMRVSSLIANTHLMDQTEIGDVLEGLKITKEISKLTSLPILFCAIIDSLKEFLKEKGDDVLFLPIQRHIVPPFVNPPKGFLRPPTVV